MNSAQFSGWLDKMSQPSLSRNQAKPLIMGVLNITSDSFYDGGKFLSMDRACEHAFTMIAEGADIIDVGGESSKPGAVQIPTDLEMARVIPVIEQIRSGSDVCISIDTCKPEVMQAAVAAGANIINDINALQLEGALDMAAKLAVPVCLMHMQGTPQNMQNNPQYPEGIETHLMQFFRERIAACVSSGIDKNKLILDPGFGFGKTVENNLRLTNKLDLFLEFKLPLLLGVSRKSTIGIILGKEVNERLIGGIALAVYAAMKGVGIIRTHDVSETNQALEMIHALSAAD